MENDYSNRYSLSPEQKSARIVERVIAAMAGVTLTPEDAEKIAECARAAVQPRKGEAQRGE